MRRGPLFATLATTLTALPGRALHMCTTPAGSAAISPLPIDQWALTGLIGARPTEERTGSI